MDIQPRPYRPDDLPRLLAFLGRRNAEADLAIPMHPGDLVHHMTNTTRGGDPSPYFHIVDGADGEPLALVELYRHGAFEIVLRPEEQGGALHRGLMRWAIDAARNIAVQNGRTVEQIFSDAFSGDPVGTALLTEFGFTPTSGTPAMAVTVRDIDRPIPAPALPEGFMIRPAAGLHEADAVGALHAAAFNSNWLPGMYAKVMMANGFDIEREMLVVAPSGELASFLVYWLDPISRSGLFEPVGCAPAYQRRGLTKALMLHTLGLMRDAGMTRAVVKHELDNAASTAAYASLGFVRRFGYTEYSRAV